MRIGAGFLADRIQKHRTQPFGRDTAANSSSHSALVELQLAEFPQLRVEVLQVVQTGDGENQFVVAIEPREGEVTNNRPKPAPWLVDTFAQHLDDKAVTIQSLRGTVVRLKTFDTRGGVAHGFSGLVVGSILEDSRQGESVLFDRGIPDVVGYLRHAKKPVDLNDYRHSILQMNYHKTVFFAPPWEGI